MKRKLRLVCGGMILCALLGLPLSLSLAASDVEVSIDAPAMVDPDSDFTARVNVTEVSDFDACQFDVTYDPGVIEVTDVTAGNIGGATIPIAMWGLIEPGRIRVIGNVPGIPGVDGSGYMAEIHFHVIGSPGNTSAIDLSNGLLGDKYANPITPVTWVGASVTVNTPLPGSITIVKETDPDGSTDFDFTGDLGGFSLDDGGSNVFSDLLPDDYDVTEAIPSGWDLDSVVCTGGDSDPIGNGVTIHLDPSEAITCTFTNVQHGSITVVKETNPDGGTGFDFSGDLGSFSLDDGGSRMFSNLLPDDYDVTEAVPSGWDLDSVVCTGGDSDPIGNGVRVHLDPGEQIVCTFTNAQRGSITIVKETDPDGGTGFNFSGDLGGFSLGDGGSHVFGNLLADDYDVTEAVPSGWDLDSVVCTGGDSDPISNGVAVHLDPGEQIVCTFTNVQVGPSPPDYFIYLPLIQNNSAVATAWSWGVSLPRSTASRR